MKKKYRIKTWDELKSMEGVKTYGYRALRFEDCSFTYGMRCLSGKIIEVDFDEHYNIRFDEGYVWKWMCEEIPQFKEGDLVLVKDFCDDDWLPNPATYLMTRKDGVHICQITDDVISFYQEIMLYTKPTTALEDLIELRKRSNQPELDEIIKKLSLAL